MFARVPLRASLPSLRIEGMNLEILLTAFLSRSLLAWRDPAVRRHRRRLLGLAYANSPLEDRGCGVHRGARSEVCLLAFHCLRRFRLKQSGIECNSFCEKLRRKMLLFGRAWVGADTEEVHSFSTITDQVLRSPENRIERVSRKITGFQAKTACYFDSSDLGTVNVSRIRSASRILQRGRH